MDFAKFDITGMSESDFLDNPLLDFESRLNRKTGEVLSSKAEYKNGFFKLNHLNNKISFEGSLHKFLHGVNHTDFNYLDAFKVIEVFKSDFGINPEKTILRNIEFGVNVKTDIDPDDIIKDYAEHRRKPFIYMPKDKKNGLTLGKQCDKGRFKIKIYNKGKQYNLSSNLMRFELKVVKMEQLHKHWEIPVYTLADLLNVDNWYLFKTQLLQYYDKILRVEKVNLKEMTIKEIDAYKDFFSPRSRKIMRDNFKRNTYINRLKKYKEVIEIHGIESQTVTLENAINEKIKELINCTNVPLLKLKLLPEKLNFQNANCTNVPLLKNENICISTRP